MEFNNNEEIWPIGQQEIHLEKISLKRSDYLFFSVKKIIDFWGSLACLLVVLPFFPIFALMIKLDSPGPVLFVQERVGRNGRRFYMYKLRTMKTMGDESPHKERILSEISGNQLRNTGEIPILGKVPDDPRVTRVGKWLRRFSLDELPNLVNVLRGEMSLVGPRPPLPYEVAAYNNREKKRLLVKGGITGLWQVSGRGKLSFTQMIDLDLVYINRKSLKLDLLILIKTIPTVLRGEFETR